MSTPTDKDEDNSNCPSVSSTSDGPNSPLTPPIAALLEMQREYSERTEKSG